MKFYRRNGFSSSTTDFFYTYQNATDPPPPSVIEIPVQDQPSFSQSQSPGASDAATMIASAYRSYRVRTLFKIVSSVNFEANFWESRLRCQETVDAVRTNELQRTKINEALMGLLFRLDSVPGIDPAVRELRRHVSRKIVGLQEILDAVSDARVDNYDGFLRDWDDVVENIEKQVCEERGGGHEMEKFCAEYLGFRCLQRFLGDQ